MLNHITIMGRLTRDPELRYTQSQIAVTSFTVAVDRDYAAQDQEKETDFVDCVAWRHTGEFVKNYFAKGSMIVVSGRLASRRWQDRDGNKRTNWEIVADNVYFGGNKSDNQSSGQYAAPPQQSVPSGGYRQGGGYQPQSQLSSPPPNRGSSIQPPGGAVNVYPGQQEFQELDDSDGELPF